MKSVDSIARMDNTSKNRVSIVGAEKVLNKYENNGTVYQLDCFRCIISLTYKVTLFRVDLFANL